MIKFHNQVPSVYSNTSRDFQYLGWLIDIVLNSVKHNVDDLYDLPKSKTDTRLTELLAMTLGFKVKRNYDQQQLKALVEALPRILKYKGTLTAVTLAGNALVAASGAIGDFMVDKEKTTGGELAVILPKSLIDISLFTDLLPYILPAGMTCHITRKNQIDKDYTTPLAMQEALIANFEHDLDWDDAKHTTTGLSELFNTGFSSSEYANYIAKDGSRPVNEKLSLSNRTLNSGLLNNTMIPAVSTPLRDTAGINQDITSGDITSGEE